VKLKLKKLSFDAGRPVVFLHADSAKRLNIHVGDRVGIRHKNRRLISIADIVKGFLRPGEVALSKEILREIQLKEGLLVDVTSVPEPISTHLISKKMSGRELSKAEIRQIIKDIVNNELTEAEIAYFVLGVYEKGMTLKETIYLTEAIYKTGHVLFWSGKKTADKHSIGGIPGNRTTPIIVSICSAAGILMPKTSSRAITSASGTADTLECITKVDLSFQDLKKVINKTGACLAWGGSLGIAPADDKLIRVERILNLDPESQLIASILAKKLAAGSKYVLLDLPYGSGAKIPTKARAIRLKRKFLEVGRYFKLHIKVILSYVNQPIGNGIGPVLEMLDILKVLKRQNPPLDLESKSLILSGHILEMSGKAEKGKGYQLALEILNSKKALHKFNEIINAQGRTGLPLKPAKRSFAIKSGSSGKIKSISNALINHLARILGSPADKGAGIYLHRHIGDKVKKASPLVTLYSESKTRLKEALAFYKKSRPIHVGN